METLDTKKVEIVRVVESKQEKFGKISDAIWSYA